MFYLNKLPRIVCTDNIDLFKGVMVLLGFTTLLCLLFQDRQPAFWVVLIVLTSLLRVILIGEVVKTHLKPRLVIRVTYTKHDCFWFKRNKTCVSYMPDKVVYRHLKRHPQRCWATAATQEQTPGFSRLPLWTPTLIEWTLFGSLLKDQSHYLRAGAKVRVLGQMVAKTPFAISNLWHW